MNQKRMEVLEKGKKDTRWTLAALTSAVLALTVSGIQCNSQAPAREIQPIEEELENRVEWPPITGGCTPSHDYRPAKDYRSRNYEP